MKPMDTVERIESLAREFRANAEFVARATNNKRVSFETVAQVSDIWDCAACRVEMLAEEIHALEQVGQLK